MTKSISVTKIRQLMTMISLILLTLSITSIVARGFNWGLDFTGGVVADIQTKPNVTQVQLKSHLDSALSQDVQVTAAGSEGNGNCVSMIQTSICETHLTKHCCQ